MSTVTSFRIPQETLFGHGAIANLPEKAKEFAALSSKTQVLLVTDRGLQLTGLADRAAGLLTDAGLNVTTFFDIAGEPSLETLESCRALLHGGNYGLVVGIGGGSALDTAKGAAALAHQAAPAHTYVGTNLIPVAGLPIIALPTTAGTASEVTPNAIFADTRDNVKKGIVSPHLIPQVAIVDPELTYSCPPAVTAASGMDALVHAIESYLSPKATLLTRLNAGKAISLISAHLRRVVADGMDRVAREAMAWGSLLAGFSFANAGVGGVHALAYPLGGRFHVSHGVSNALLLAPVMRFSAPANPQAFAEIAVAMGLSAESRSEAELAPLAAEEMQSLGRDVGIPQRMRDLDVPQEAIRSMASAAAGIGRLLANCPRPLTEDDIYAIYSEAW